jgi:hypothetical protein
MLSIQSVLKGIHFLLNNIRHLAQAAYKKSGGLNNGCAYVLVRVIAHQDSHLGLKRFPKMGLFGEHVVHAFDGGNFLSHDEINGELKLNLRS